MGGGDEHGASARLESILTDSSAPRAERVWAAGAIELGMLLRLAVPAVIMYMINFLMSMSTQIFSGHLGSLELAAASLGNTGVQMFAYGLMVRAHARSPSISPPNHSALAVSRQKYTLARRHSAFWCRFGVVDPKRRVAHS